MLRERSGLGLGEIQPCELRLEQRPRLASLTWTAARGRSRQRPTLSDLLARSRLLRCRSIRDECPSSACPAGCNPSELLLAPVLLGCLPSKQVRDVAGLSRRGERTMRRTVREDVRLEREGVHKLCRRRPRRQGRQGELERVGGDGKGIQLRDTHKRGCLQVRGECRAA